MFWKKSKNKTDRSEILHSIPSDARSSFRVTPSLNSPLEATLNDQPISIIDISSGGFRCKINDLIVGNTYSAKITLPPDYELISVVVEILGNNEEQNCRCRFMELPQDFENHIHRYVLYRQKEEQEHLKDTILEK